MSYRPFPRTVKSDIWERYLRRELTTKEERLLAKTKTENFYNRTVEELHNMASSKNLYIPALTEYDGNCFFSSLQMLGFCDDADEFKKALSVLLETFKDHKGIFKKAHGSENTIKEIYDDFDGTNENTKYVICLEEERIYKYTFETMCHDLLNNSSWSRLPTQLIMTFISLLFSVRFEIVSNLSSYVNVIDMNNGESKHTIYLGHLGELHYVPLKLREEGREYECPYYDEYRKKFFEWAYEREKEVNFSYRD